MIISHKLIFAAFQTGACIYALWRGALPERLVAIMMAGATAGTAFLPTYATTSFRNVELSELYIDAFMFAGLYALSLVAQRFWPMWVAALQLIAIGIHGVRAYDPTLLPIVYARTLGEIAYPMIMLLIVGTYRHTRRLAKFGADPNWSPLKLY